MFNYFIPTVHAQTIPDSLSITSVMNVADAYVSANITQATAYAPFITSLIWILVPLGIILSVIGAIWAAVHFWGRRK